MLVESLPLTEHPAMFHTLSLCSNISLLIFTTLWEKFYYNFIDKETEAQRSGLSKVTSSSSDNWGLNPDAPLSSISYAREAVDWEARIWIHFLGWLMTHCVYLDPCLGTFVPWFPYLPVWGQLFCDLVNIESVGS